MHAASTSYDADAPGWYQQSQQDGGDPAASRTPPHTEQVPFTVKEADVALRGDDMNAAISFNKTAATHHEPHKCTIGAERVWLNASRAGPSPGGWARGGGQAVSAPGRAGAQRDG